LTIKAVIIKNNAKIENLLKKSEICVDKAY